MNPTPIYTPTPDPVLAYREAAADWGMADHNARVAFAGEQDARRRLKRELDALGTSTTPAAVSAWWHNPALAEAATAVQNGYQCTLIARRLLTVAEVRLHNAELALRRFLQKA